VRAVRDQIGDQCLGAGQNLDQVRKPPEPIIQSYVQLHFDAVIRNQNGSKRAWTCSSWLPHGPRGGTRPYVRKLLSGYSAGNLRLYQPRATIFNSVVGRASMFQLIGTIAERIQDKLKNVFIGLGLS